jgi:TetR/AcrR family transcriptional repressor of nem operon
MTDRNDKAAAILDSARVLMMDRGYNGFSFRDIAAEVGIKSASIHYHFATKADLAEATARAYREAFNAALDGLKARSTPELLRAYGSLFVATLQERGGLCLGGILAADASTLPDQVRAEVIAFFDAQRAWIAAVIRDGQARMELRQDVDADALAATFVSSLEGSMMVARATLRPGDLETTLNQLIHLISV